MITFELFLYFENQYQSNKINIQKVDLFKLPF